jgi:hypothetical protein
MGVASEHSTNIPRCPNCGATLASTPQRKTKCPQCRKFIYSRKLDDNGEKQLISEEEAARMEQDREADVRRYILESQMRVRAELADTSLDSVFPFIITRAFAVHGELCPVCLAHDNRIDPVRHAQLPPFEGCSCEGGCRCDAIRLMESDLADAGQLR